MTTISRIQLRNFQSHENTTIEPAPAGGLTVITGESDAGKTAIMRALRWALYNQPQGDAFRRVGCEFVEVSIDTDRGSVVRRRTATTNRYIVNGQPLEGFGASVPLEVQDVTGVRPVRLGDQEVPVNFASQLEAPFLGSGISAPTRAKVLDKLAGSEIISQAAKELNTDLYRLRQDAKRLEAEAAQLRAQMAEYGYLPSLAGRIAKLKSLAEGIQRAQERLGALEQLRARLQDLEDKREEALRTLGRFGDIEGAALRLRFAEKLHNAYRLFNSLAQSLDALNKQKARALHILTRCGDPGAASQALARAVEGHQRCSALSQIQSNLVRLAKRHQDTLSLINSIGNVEAASAAVGRALTSHGRLSQLSVLRGRLQALEAAREQEHRRIHRFRHVDKAASMVADVHRVQTLGFYLATYQGRLYDIQRKRDQTIKTLEAASAALKQYQGLYLKALAEAGVCPTCGAPIREDHIKEAMSA